MFLKMLLLLAVLYVDYTTARVHASNLRNTRYLRPNILYRWKSTKDYCEDNNCDTNAECLSSAEEKSFSCQCNDGFQGDGLACDDVDECIDDSNNDCHSNADCRNSPGGFSCKCQTGYAGDGVTCEDDDECADEDTNSCHKIFAKCTNSVGSFTCDCNEGYAGDGVKCKDINECLKGTDSCHSEANCVNTRGAYLCRCKNGYRGDGVSCEDIDECAEKTDTCDKSGAFNCVNTPGKFTCPCAEGFEGSDGSCVDVDECADASKINCDVNANCGNIAGGYTCTCKTGFLGEGQTCTDIDECVERSDICGDFAECTNNPGSYICTCIAGYRGDGQNCTEIPTCEEGYGQLDNKCYKYFYAQKTWYDARQGCLDIGGDLVSVNSQAELLFVRKFANKFRAGARSMYWTGLNDQENERETAKDGWVWSDGSGVTTGTEPYSMFTKKGPKENKKGDQDCIFAFGPSMNWFSTRCNTLRPFMCKKPLL